MPEVLVEGFCTAMCPDYQLQSRTAHANENSLEVIDPLGQGRTIERLATKKFERNVRGHFWCTAVPVHALASILMLPCTYGFTFHLVYPKHTKFCFAAGRQIASTQCQEWRNSFTYRQQAMPLPPVWAINITCVHDTCKHFGQHAFGRMHCS